MVEELFSSIEKILRRIEDHIEWRRQYRARNAEAEADRDKLWAEAREQECYSDLMEQARLAQGLERLDQIKYAVLESSGSISIIPK